MSAALPPTIRVTFMYFGITYFWVNKSYLLTCKGKTMRVVKKPICFVWKKIHHKNSLWILLKRRTVIVKNFFSFKLENDTVMKTLCYLYMIFDGKWPGHKPLSYINAYCVCIYIYLFFLPLYCFFRYLKLAWQKMVVEGYLLIDIYVYRIFFPEEKMTSLYKKIIYHDLVMYYIYIYWGKHYQPRKLLIFI